MRNQKWVKSDSYPQIDRLIEAITTLKLVITVAPRSAELDRLDCRRIQLHYSRQDLMIPVSDEYGDADLNTPVVLLHLVLQACEFYEEAADFLIWAKDLGLNASDPLARQIYFELREAVPQVRALLGHDLKAIPAFDIELNTGLARALRSARVL